MPRPCLALLVGLAMTTLVAAEDPSGARQPAGPNDFLPRLLEWGRKYPELAASLRRRLGELAQDGEAASDGLARLQDDIDAWLLAHAGELTDLEELPEATREEDLERALEVRRRLVQELAGPVEQTLGEPEEAVGLGTLAWRGLKRVLGRAWERLVGGEAGPEPELQIEAADGSR